MTVICINEPVNVMHVMRWHIHQFNMTSFYRRRCIKTFTFLLSCIKRHLCKETDIPIFCHVLYCKMYIKIFNITGVYALKSTTFLWYALKCNSGIHGDIICQKSKGIVTIVHQIRGNWPNWAQFQLVLDKTTNSIKYLVA